MLRRPLPPPPPPLAPLPLHSPLALLCSPPTVAAAVALSEAFKMKTLLSPTSPPAFLSTSPPKCPLRSPSPSRRSSKLPPSPPSRCSSRPPPSFSSSSPPPRFPPTSPPRCQLRSPSPSRCPSRPPPSSPPRRIDRVPPIEIPTDVPIEAPIPIRLPADDRSIAARIRATEIVRLAKIRAAANRMSDFDGEVITVEAEVHAPPDDDDIEDVDERVVCTANTFCTKYWQYHHALVQI